MTYKIRICRYCRRQVTWDQRDRTGFGWYCRNHSAAGHPKRFYGYLSAADAVEITVEPEPLSQHDGLCPAAERHDTAGGLKIAEMMLRNLLVAHRSRGHEPSADLNRATAAVGQAIVLLEEMDRPLGEDE